MRPRLNTWTLGGLMVGPILGSGIVLLPPLAFARLGPQAIWAWVAVLLLGAAFALVFIKMTLRARTDSGIAALVAREWGAVWGELASNYLSGAVVFGAVPVLLTAARLWPTEWSLGMSADLWAAGFLAVTTGLLLAGLTTVSGVTLVLSTATAVLLVSGGLLGLAGPHPFSWPAPEIHPGLGPTLLLLFWAVVGWEVVANYSGDVKDPESTVPRAGFVSLVAVSVVYLVTTLALQTLAPPAAAPTMATVLEPLLGPWAAWVAGILATGLCLGTLLMFLGAVTRMTAERAAQGRFPRWWAERRPGTPRRAILTLTVTSSALLLAVHGGLTSVEDLVSVANLFFLGNALLGLAAAWKILPGTAWRVTIGVLAGVLVLLLAQGQLVGWLLLGVVTVATLVQSRFKAPDVGS